MILEHIKSLKMRIKDGEVLFVTFFKFSSALIGEIL